MNVLATMTTKGQLTMPKRARDRLRLRPGDRVEIDVLSDEEARLRPVRVTVDDVFGLLKGLSRRKVTEAAIRRGVTAHLRRKHGR